MQYLAAQVFLRLNRAPGSLQRAKKNNIIRQSSAGLHK